MRASVSWLFVAAAVFSSTNWVLAQDNEPPKAVTLDQKTKVEIGDKHHALQTQLVSLKDQGARDPFLADVEVFLKAATWAEENNEYYSADSGKWAVDLLDRGLLRASLLQHDSQQVFGSRWYVDPGKPVVLGYRSRIDDSVQPYVVTYPKGYGNDPKVKWRLDVVLHGRSKDGSEIKFLHERLNSSAQPDAPYVQLEVFGRGNNGYRWAGETDVMEAVNNFVTIERFIRRADLIDTRRMVLRGFSMGGAGTWHMGLHRPDSMCVIGPGAGFTTTHSYVKDLPEKLPAYVERCLHIYDAVDYADNAFDVPIVAYAGDQDPQLQAALNIEARLKADGLSMTLLKAPGLKHEFPRPWQDKAEAEYAKYAGPGKGRKEYPERVWFTTYTMKYPSCDWVEILGMDAHYYRARVDATRTNDGFTVKTTNVRALKLTLPPNERDPQRILIGDEVIATPVLIGNSYVVFLEQQGGKWVSVLSQKIVNDQMRKAQKISGLQGPIDDAFSDSFLCVRGTGAAWNAGVQRYADAELDRFTKDWSRFFRGKLLVKNDVNVTESDMASRNLILFGDPGSNSLIAQVVDGLPLKWNKESITFDGQTYDSASHVPVMVYPSPVNLNKYVVLNSGHTFHESDFLGTNALLYPRLGDYAILKTTAAGTGSPAAEVVTAGLFDDSWKLPSK